MKLLKMILVAVDFDDTLDAVLATAGTLAKRFGSEVTLLHVVETDVELSEAPESLRDAIDARLEQMQQQLTANGVSVPQVFCLYGKASVEIVEAAERIKANLIVLGTRGVVAYHQFVLGTTTENVIRCSPKPVLAVPPGPALTFANIACPVDFSEVSARGLTTAIHLARAFRSKLAQAGAAAALAPESRHEHTDLEVGRSGAGNDAVPDARLPAR
jgi:nucleotide-binding universal stress UspA family protein